jgi:hypothetical protein
MAMIFRTDFSPENGDSMLLRNVGTHLPGYTVSQLRRPQYEVWSYGLYRLRINSETTNSYGFQTQVVRIISFS